MAYHPPEMNPTSRLFIRVLRATWDWSPRRGALAAAGAYAAVMIADWRIGAASVNLGVLFMVICAFAVWTMGEARGTALNMAVALGLSAIRHDQLQHGVFVHAVGMGAELFNLFSRLLTFALIGVVVNGLRAAVALERWHGATDSLTGALNKGAFEGEVETAAAKARATGQTLVLAYMDLDGFKSVNDGHGHSAGDRVLRSFATGTAEAIRANDLFARVGGDEFVALLTVANQEEGERVVELLHRRLTGILAATGLPVTCSMGALVMSSRDAAMDDGIMERADALMYEVKRTGKNGFRLARGGAVGTMLHASYQPLEDESLTDLLDRIDVAERTPCRLARRAA